MVQYPVATISLLRLHRPRAAFRVGLRGAKEGLGHGMLIGFAIGAVLGSTVGQIDGGRAGRGALWGAGIGTVGLGAAGALMSFQSDYDGGWVIVRSGQPPATAR